MSIKKNQVTANEIDILFQKTWCDECVDGGYCFGCLVYEALEAANKLTKRAHDAASLSAPDDTTGAFDESIIGSLP